MRQRTEGTMSGARSGRRSSGMVSMDAARNVWCFLTSAQFSPSEATAAVCRPLTAPILFSHVVDVRKALHAVVFQCQSTSTSARFSSGVGGWRQIADAVRSSSQKLRTSGPSRRGSTSFQPFGLHLLVGSCRFRASFMAAMSFPAAMVALLLMRRACPDIPASGSRVVCTR